MDLLSVIERKIFLKKQAKFILGQEIEGDIQDLERELLRVQKDKSLNLQEFKNDRLRKSML